jgi:tetratricopeptide (TPR) repeat protein
LEKSSSIKAQAQKYLSNGNLDKAVEEYEKLLLLEDTDPYDYVLVADVHLKKKSTERAISLYVESIDSYEKLGLYKNAVAICTRVLRLDPSMSDIYKRRGDIRVRAGLATEAVQDFLKYYEMKLREGDKAAALEGLERAAKANPMDVGIGEKLANLYERTAQANLAAAELTRLSQLLRQSGDVTKARQFVEKASRLDPGGAGEAAPEKTVTPEPAAKSVPEVEAAVEPEMKAESQLEEEAEVESDVEPEIEPIPAPSEAAVEEPTEEPVEEPAEEAIEEPGGETVEVAPIGEAEAGEAVSAEQEEPDAEVPEKEESPFEGLKQRPLSRPSTVNISHVLKQFKAQMEGTLSPDDYQAHYDLGVTYKEMELHEEALNEFRVASAAPEYRAKAFEMAGLCHLEMGEPGEAVEAFRRALGERTREDEDYAGLCFNLGRALEAMGEAEEALQNYREVASLNPDFPGLQERLQLLGDRKEEVEL